MISIPRQNVSRTSQIKSPVCAPLAGLRRQAQPTVLAVWSRAWGNQFGRAVLGFFDPPKSPQKGDALVFDPMLTPLFALGLPLGLGNCQLLLMEGSLCGVLPFTPLQPAPPRGVPIRPTQFVAHQPPPTYGNYQQGRRGKVPGCACIALIGYMFQE